MRKPLSAVLICAMAVSMMAGCGDGAQETTAPQTEAETESPTVEATEAKEQTEAESESQETEGGDTYS